MKIKLVEVGDGLGTILLPLPRSIMVQLGWFDGEEVVMDIPFPHDDTLHISLPERSK